VECHACNVLLYQGTEAEAITAWNTRTAHSGEAERWERIAAQRLVEISDKADEIAALRGRVEALEGAGRRVCDGQATPASVNNLRTILNEGMIPRTAHSGEGRSNGAGEDGLSSALAEHFPAGIRGLYDQSAQGIPVKTHVGTNCLCGWCTSATDEQEVREEWAAHVAAALSAPQGDDKTILKELRPSKKAMEKIDRIAQANAAGMAALRDMPLGSAAPQGEVERLQRLVDAYRLLAVNEGWNHRMVDAYGHAEYLAHRIAEVDRKASGTVVSGYDAAKYLRDGLAALAQPEAGGE
jgi:hypothetical protein